MLSAIGETLESPYDSSSPAASNTAEAITGIIMSARPNLYRIAIWTRTADESASGELDPALLNIGKHFKVGILGYQLNQQVGGGGMQSDVEFQSHKDSERKGKGRKFVV
jgi:translation initiation factor 4E